MAENKLFQQLHASAAIILLLGAIIAYSLGFARDIGALLIGGVIFELGFWMILFSTKWRAGPNGS